jgi:hypothetical protein
MGSSPIEVLQLMRARKLYPGLRAMKLLGHRSKSEGI